MDPNATLALIKGLTATLDQITDPAEYAEHLHDLRDAVTDLYAWVNKGGFLPSPR